MRDNHFGGFDGEEQFFASGVASGTECYLQYEGAPAVGFEVWYHHFKGGVTLADSGWVYPHPADRVLVY